jgi:hypothetical protein
MKPIGPLAIALKRSNRKALMIAAVLIVLLVVGLLI